MNFIQSIIYTCITSVVSIHRQDLVLNSISFLPYLAAGQSLMHIPPGLGQIVRRLVFVQLPVQPVHVPLAEKATDDAETGACDDETTAVFVARLLRCQLRSVSTAIALFEICFTYEEVWTEPVGHRCDAVRDSDQRAALCARTSDVRRLPWNVNLQSLSETSLYNGRTLCNSRSDRQTVPRTLKTCQSTSRLGSRSRS